MAKKATKTIKKPARKPRSATAKPSRPKSSKAHPKPAKRPARPRAAKSGQSISAADALVDLLESPLVADILAAGAAAALATMTAHGFSRRREGTSTSQALKRAGKAAAAAMGARISEELDEILASAKQAKRESR
jgi:hypothetical protein